MRFTENNRKKLSINITPLIDVLFLLVIFVLVTAQFEDVGGISVDLPQGKSKELPEIQTLNLVLTSDGEYYLEDRNIPLENLEEELKQLSLKAKESILIVKADKGVRWEMVALAIDTAKNVGLKKIAFKILN